MTKSPKLKRLLKEGSFVVVCLGLLLGAHYHGRYEGYKTGFRDGSLNAFKEVISIRKKTNEKMRTMGFCQLLQEGLEELQCKPKKAERKPRPA